MLEIQGLTVRYGKKLPAVLQNLSLTIGAQTVTAVIGSSGAGKSTLLRSINRLVEPEAGAIVLNGADIMQVHGRQLQRVRRRIGMIFQAYNLVERLTVMENVLSGRLGYVGVARGVLRRFPQQDIDRAYALLKRVKMQNYIHTRCDSLSGGERQRVGVVRALMQNPDILLADEPTASLDPKTAEQIMELIAGLAHEFSLPVLINLHNVHQAREYSNRIVGLRRGRIVFDDGPASLDQLTLDEIYADAHQESSTDRVDRKQQSVPATHPSGLEVGP